MFSFKSLKAQYKKLRWWQTIIIILVGVYLLNFILKALNINTPTLPSFNLQGAEHYTNNGSTLTCTMYYTTWCGYCKQAKPEWEKLSAEYNGKSIDGTKVLITKIDCDENPDAAKKAGVEGFPTFKFDIDGKYLNYSGGRTYAEFKKYIESVLHSDRS